MRPAPRRSRRRAPIGPLYTCGTVRQQTRGFNDTGGYLPPGRRREATRERVDCRSGSSNSAGVLLAERSTVQPEDAGACTNPVWPADLGTSALTPDNRAQILLIRRRPGFARVAGNLRRFGLIGALRRAALQAGGRRFDPGWLHGGSGCTAPRSCSAAVAWRLSPSCTPVPNLGRTHECGRSPASGPGGGALRECPPPGVDGAAGVAFPELCPQRPPTVIAGVSPARDRFGSRGSRFASA